MEEARLTALLEVDALVVRRAERTILAGVSLTVAAGEFVALMGESGGGKTTLLKAVAGLTPFQEGSVVLDGVRLLPGGLPRGELARRLRERVGLVFQSAALFDHLDVRRNVTLAPVHVLKKTESEAIRDADRLLDLLGVLPRASAHPSELSGGEAQRVAIARAMAMDPPLLMLDEPTAPLDPERRGELGELLRSLVRRGATLLVATHDRSFAEAFADRTIALTDGTIPG